MSGLNEKLDAYELVAYLKRLRLPTTDPGSYIPNLATLALLQQQHLLFIPFENTTQHYNTDEPPLVCLDKDALINGRLLRTGRGGYCMQNNTLFALLLRALGFQVTTVGSRVRDPDGDYGGWTHMVLLVKPVDQDRQYHIDVGFGFKGPIEPMLLEEGIIKRHTYDRTAISEERQLRYDEAGRIWIYSFQVVGDSENFNEHQWTEIYAFCEVPFTSKDYEVMNHYIGHSSEPFFRREVVAVRFQLSLVGSGSTEANVKGPVAQIRVVKTLQNRSFKTRLDGKIIKQITICNEADRVKILRNEFGIEITEEEAQSIVGRIGELVQT
jgi:arylamine N-acetyltransferase